MQPPQRGLDPQVQNYNMSFCLNALTELKPVYHPLIRCSKENFNVNIQVALDFYL